MKKTWLLLAILAVILLVNLAIIQNQYGRPSSSEESDVARATEDDERSVDAVPPRDPEARIEGKPAPANPTSDDAPGSPETRPAALGDVSNDTPSTDSEPPTTEEENGAAAEPDAEADEPEEDEDPWLFPKLKERAAYPVPPDFGRDHPIWSAATRAANEFSGIDEGRFDEVVATVNARPVTYREVLEEVVLRFGEKFVEEYRNDLILLREITGAGIEISDEDLKLGEAEFWEQLKQQRVTNLDELQRKFKWTEEFLRRKVYLNEGGKKIFAGDMGVEDPTKSEPLFLQVWMGEIVGRYEIRSVYGEGAEELEDGVLARIDERDITSLVIAPFLLPNLKRFHFSMALESLIEWRILQDALKEKGIEITAEEVEAAINAERAKYAGSFFNYETMLQLSDTNIPMERRKFTVWLAYDRLFGEPTDEQLREHFASFPVYFGRGAVAACEIKTLALDPETGRLKGEDAWNGALQKILEARAELETGKPFQGLVMRFSEDANTKKFDNATLFDGKSRRVAGSIGIFPIKEGRMANEIASAVFFAPKGEWIGPVRGRDGYHLLYLLDTKSPRDIRYEPEAYTDVNENGRFDQGEPFVDDNRNGHWNDGQRDNAYDDFQGERVSLWLETLTAGADVQRLEFEFR